MAAEWEVGDHLLVGKLIPLCALDHTVQNQHVSVGFAANVGAKTSPMTRQ